MAAVPISTLRAVAVVTFAGLLVLAASACKNDDKTPADADADEAKGLAEDGADSTAAETDIEVVTSSLVSAAAPSGSLTLASTGDLSIGGVGTEGVGDGAKALYFPRSCLTVTSIEAEKKVTYAFANCAGPNGIYKITGTIVATYETSANKLVLNLVGNDLTVNKAAIDWSSTAEVTADGPAREMHWKGALSGVTRRGKAFSRTDEKVVKWRFLERCFAVSGVSEGKVRDRYLRTEITDFRQCQGACPEAGGRITISNASKLKVDITFDGSNIATYTTPKVQTTFTLACE